MSGANRKKRRSTKPKRRRDENEIDSQSDRLDDVEEKSTIKRQISQD